MKKLIACLAFALLSACVAGDPSLSETEQGIRSEAADLEVAAPGDPICRESTELCYDANGCLGERIIIFCCQLVGIYWRCSGAQSPCYCTGTVPMDEPTTSPL